ncbi:MAG: ABC-2 family transporter protein [Acidimicrobiia bacterium]|nr:ABC-2 family transporter protein [Acidimicrobiia bacterium]
MALYRALFVAGFRRQATYRLALLSGLGTNVFFGIVRTALFLALYRQRGEVGGLDQADALTYVWVLQALFGVIWASWIWELPDSVRSGDFVAELTRPGDPFGRLLAFDLGRATNLALLRSTLPLVGAALLLDLRLPTTAGGWALTLVSFALAAVVGFEVRFLLGAAAFWTPDYRGVFSLVFPPLWLLSGFLIPVELFPGALRTVAEASPLTAMLTAPVRVVTGADVGGALTAQLVWCVLLLAACRAVMGLAQRRLVVHGG